MFAAQFVALQGPQSIQVANVPDAVADENQVLIRTRAIGVGFPEVLQSRGRYQVQPDLPFVPGAEVAGEIVSAPPGSGLSPGDRVAALPVLGGFAELVAASPTLTFQLPESTSFEEGASLPFNYLTAYFALIERGQLRSGDSVMVHGAAGGIGTASIQVAKAFGAGRVVAVTSTVEKGAVALATGADEFVLADGFREAVTAGGKIDVVVDPVGGDRFTDSLRSLSEHGRLLVIGFSGGEIPTVKVNRLLMGNTAVIGVGWGALTMSRPAHVADQWKAIKPHIESGLLRPPVGATFALADAAEALQEIEERRATGKVLLIP